MKIEVFEDGLNDLCVLGIKNCQLGIESNKKTQKDVSLSYCIAVFDSIKNLLILREEEENDSESGN